MAANTFTIPTGSARRRTVAESRGELHAQYAQDREEEARIRHEHISSGQRLGGGNSIVPPIGQMQYQQRRPDVLVNPRADPALLAARSRQQLSYNGSAEQRQVAVEENNRIEAEREKAKRQAKLEKYAHIDTGRRLGRS